MDIHNQVNKLCGLCGNKRLYSDYHRLYNPCNICIAKISARYYQANTDRIIARPEINQENTKFLRKSHTQQIEERNNKVEELTRAMEKLFLKN